jgi:hypothetical protein
MRTGNFLVRMGFLTGFTNLDMEIILTDGTSELNVLGDL